MARADAVARRRVVWLAALVPVLWGATPAAGQDPATRVVTLREAIDLAERVQPTVVEAAGGVRNADAQRRAAYGAFLPTVTASSGGSTSFSEGAARIDPNTGLPLSGNRATNNVSVGLRASVDLFTGFRRGADIRSAKAQGDAARASLVDARFQVALLTTTEFLNALAAAQLERVREASVRRADEQLKASVAKLHAGTATRSDSLRSLVTLGAAQADLLDAHAQRITAEANLGQLIGAAGLVGAADDSAFYHPAELDTTAIRADLRGGAPQVASATASANAAKAAVSAARAAYWPTLNLAGNYNYSGSNTVNDYQLLNQRSLSLSLSWPLFNGFTRERTIVTQETNADVAEARAADTQRQVDAGLTQQLAQLTAARARMDITVTSVAAATEDLRVQQERYRLGASTIVDMLTSQEALTQAEVDAVSARFDYLRAKAQIEALIGRSL